MIPCLYSDILLILTVMYLPASAGCRRGTLSEEDRSARHAEAGRLLKCRTIIFHPGHTWVVDEGRQNARVGIDVFAANLFGKSMRSMSPSSTAGCARPAALHDHARIAASICSRRLKVLTSVNHEVLKNPNLVVEDRIATGWLCEVKAP